MKGEKGTALTGTCQGCGRPDGLRQPQHGMTYCPVCAKKQDEYSQASHHLAELIAPAVTAWREHWMARGFEADLLLEIAENSDEISDLIAALNSRGNPKPEAAVIPNTLRRAALPHRSLEVAA